MAENTPSLAERNKSDMKTIQRLYNSIWNTYPQSQHANLKNIAQPALFVYHRNGYGRTHVSLFEIEEHFEVGECESSVGGVSVSRQ